MKRGLIVFLSLVLLLVVVAVLGLGYLGYIGPVARVLGTNQPKDLGVTYTEQDLASVQEKVLLEKKVAAAGTATRYEGTRAIDETFTSAELTALVNSSQWAYTPIENVQIKVGDNGVVESSGVIDIDLLSSYLSEVAPGSVTEDELEKVVSLLPGKIPYYISGNAKYSGGANVVLDSVSVGRFSVPSGLLSENKARVDNFLDEGLKHITGLTIKSLDFNGGQMSLVGTVPKVKYRPVK